MMRFLFVIGALVLGAALYVGKAPEIAVKRAAAQEVVLQPATQQVAVVPAGPQSAVVRLAEASLAMRRVDGNPVIAAYPEPRVEKLFARK